LLAQKSNQKRAKNPKDSPHKATRPPRDFWAYALTGSCFAHRLYFYINVNYGVLPSKDFSLCSTCHFLLAQKGAKTIVFEPAFCVIAKRALCPMLPRAWLARPSLGKEAYALFLLARAAPC